MSIYIYIKKPYGWKIARPFYGMYLEKILDPKNMLPLGRGLLELKEGEPRNCRLFFLLLFFQSKIKQYLRHKSLELAIVRPLHIYPINELCDETNKISYFVKKKIYIKLYLFYSKENYVVSVL